MKRQLFLVHPHLLDVGACRRPGDVAVCTRGWGCEPEHAVTGLQNYIRNPNILKNMQMIFSPQYFSQHDFSDPIGAMSRPRPQKKPLKLPLQFSTVLNMSWCIRYFEIPYILSSCWFRSKSFKFYRKSRHLGKALGPRRGELTSEPLVTRSSGRSLSQLPRENPDVLIWIFLHKLPELSSQQYIDLLKPLVCSTSARDKKIRASEQLYKVRL